MYMMDSVPIAEFLEATYPDPPVPLKSELGLEIAVKLRAAMGSVFRATVMPREICILSPRSREYFERTREVILGHPLKDLLDPEKEKQAWSAAEAARHELEPLMLTHRAEGVFILGARPCLTDFLIAGSLQSARTVDEDIFQRMIQYQTTKDIYEACLPYMEKKD